MKARGFVLVNALVLVAALAAVAVVLLGRAESQRNRQVHSQSRMQLELYLDGFEALVITVLTADNGSVDHLQEGWARREFDVALDRGRVTSRIQDLSGRFNINWLSRPEDAMAHQGFENLAENLGLGPQMVQAITQALSTRGGAPSAAQASRVPAKTLVGGPMVFVDQLLTVPGMDKATLNRIRPYVSVLPSDSVLNVNTAPPLVLQSLLPGLGPARAQALARQRQTAPFRSVSEFISALGALGADLDETRFAVGSKWFRAHMSAALEGQSRARVTVFERRPLPQGVRVAYRLAQPN